MRSPKQVGDAIRRRRRSLALRQAELGERSGLRQATISALESGESGTHLGTLFDVLASLNMEAVVRPRHHSQPLMQHSTSSQFVRQVHATVIDSLRTWPGYDALEAAMSECAVVDVYLAGGALRDLLQSESRKPKDFDFFLGGARVEHFLERLTVDGSLRVGPFGSPRWYPHAAPDRYADIIPIAHFYNGLWKCEDIVDALNQFDFTANAIAIDLRSPRLFDPQHGLRDLQSGIVRAVRFDYPDEPISAEVSLTRLSVLWFRLIHYAQLLRFKIEPVTLRWLRGHSRFANDASSFTETFFEPDIEDFSL